MIAPIENFEMEEDIIDFYEGLIIKKLSEDELKNLNKHAMEIVNEPLESNIAFLYNLSSEKNTFEVMEKFYDSLKKALCCLRLFKSGNTGIMFDFEFEMNEDNKLNFLGASRFPDFFYGNKYFLSKHDIKRFKEFKEFFYKTKISDSGFWSLASRRFENSYGGRKLEDKLIDFIIGLEALFSEGPGDLTFKLSSRIARFLEEEKSERIKISTAIKKIYDFRSRIVHGEASKDPDFEANVDRAEGYLRLSLRKFLTLISMHGENKDELLRMIDFEL